MSAKGRVLRGLLERYLVPKQYRADVDTVQLQERGKQAGPTLSPQEQEALKQPAEGSPTPEASEAAEAPPASTEAPAESAAPPPEPGVFERALESQDLFTDPMPGRPPDMPGPEGRDLTHRTSERNINLDRVKFAKVKNADDIKALIDETARITGPEETVTHAQVSARAGKVDTLKLLAGGRPDEAWNPQQLLAARRLMMREAEALHEMAADLTEREGLAKGSVSAEDWAAFGAAKTRYVALQKVVQGKTRIAAQTLNALAITAGPTAKKARLQEIDSMLLRQGGPEEMLRQAQLISSTDPATDPTGFGKLTEKLRFGGQVAYSVWINGLLSSPTTHAVNVLSNALVNAYESVAINPLGGVFGAIRTRGGRALGLDVNPDRMYVDEVVPRIAGLISGTLDGAVTATSRALGPAGTKGIGKGSKIEAREYVLPLENPTAAYLADMALQGPSRFLDGEDQFFKVLNYRQELNTMALRTARAEGLTGEALQKRVGELVNQPTEDMHLAALETAERLTFTNRPEQGTLFGALAEAGTAARRSFGPLGFVVPFIRTPANIANYGIKNIPGFNTWQIASDLQAGGARADQAMARLTVSWASIYAVWQMVEEGQVTGAGPLNKRLMASYRDAGWHPNSVKVGDKWYQYDRLEPIGLMLGTLADAMEVVKHSKDPDNVTQVVMTALTGFANNLVDSTYLRGVADLLSISKGGESMSARTVQWLSGLGSSMQPYSSLSGYVARSGDVDEQGEAQARSAWKLSMSGQAPMWTSLVNQFKNRSPVWRDDLPLQVSWKGDYVTRDYGGYWDEAFPVKYAEVQKDPVAAALWENRVSVNPPLPKIRWDDPVYGEHESGSGTWNPTTVNLLDLDGGRGEVYERYQIFVGQARYKELEYAVEGYDKVPPEEKGSFTATAEVLRKAMNDGTRAGKEEFIDWYTGQARERGWLEPGTDEWAAAAEAVRPSVSNVANPTAPEVRMPERVRAWENVRF